MSAGAFPRGVRPDTGTEVRLSVVIPHRNDPRRLARCLSALAPQAAGDVEVIVVDDGSDTPPQVPGGVRLIAQGREGAGPARNRGVAAARGRTLAFVDADCIPAPDFVARAGAVRRVTAGRVRMFDEGAAGPGGRRSGAQAFETALAFDQARAVRKGWSATANLVVPRAVFDAVGPFRAGVAEDVDWGLRASRLGHRPVFDPALSVAHPTRASRAALATKWHRVTDEGFALARERSVGRLRWAFRIPLVAAGALTDMLRILRCPALDPGERRAAIGTMIWVRRLRIARMLHQTTGRGAQSTGQERRAEVH